MHSEPVLRDKLQYAKGQLRNEFTKGGFCKFNQELVRENPSHLESDFHNDRTGYYGWMGLGGSILQWNPEHKISFAYVPRLYNFIDMYNTKGGQIQEILMKCIQGCPPPRREPKGCGCTIF